MKFPAIRNRNAIKLVLAMMIMVACGGLLGGTLSSLSSVTENPSSFGAGTLVLRNGVENQAPCLSLGSTLRCSELFDISLFAGQTVTGRVTLQNVGTAPVNRLLFYSTACRTSDSREGAFHGTADLCQSVQVKVHDDVNDYCYYPGPAPGACGFSAGATLADLTSRHGTSTPLILSADHLGAGITLTVTARLDASLDNRAQGRIARMDFIWQATQA